VNVLPSLAPSLYTLSTRLPFARGPRKFDVAHASYDVTVVVAVLVCVLVVVLTCVVVDVDMVVIVVEIVDVVEA
jgi:hypothetical protein